MICNSYGMFFKTLADKSKLEIINLLSKGELNVNQLCIKLGFEQSRVSHNLKSLESRNFVTKKIQGKQRIYSLDKEIIHILKHIDSHVSKYYKNYCECKGIPWRNKK